MQNQGLAQAAMYRGIGNAAGGALGELAQYKREEPARKEAERLRKEKDKLRGIEQMAGAAMESGQIDPATGKPFDASSYGRMLQKEGFAELGQDKIDKDMSRKNTIAQYEDSTRAREQKRLSEVVFKIDEIRNSKDPSAYTTGYDALVKKYADLNLPPAYDGTAIDAFVKGIESKQDILDRNARAEAESKKLNDKTLTYIQHVTAAKAMMAPLAPRAHSKEQWDGMWRNFDARTENFTPEEKARMEAEIPYPREYSEQAYQSAVDLERGPAKDPSSPLGAAYQLFRERHNREPVSKEDEAEIESTVTRLTRASHVPTAGRGGRGKATQAQQAVADRWAKAQYDALEKRRLLDPETYTDAVMDAEKERIQASYMSQLGIDDGPTLEELGAQKGEDISGRPLAAQAQPGAAGAAPAAAARAAGASPNVPAGMVPVINPDTGKPAGYLPLEKARDIERQSGKKIIAGQPAAAAPTAPAAAGAPAGDPWANPWYRGPKQFPQEAAPAQAPPQQGPPPQQELPPQMLAALGYQGNSSASGGDMSRGLPMRPPEQAAPQQAAPPPPRPAKPQQVTLVNKFGDEVKVLSTDEEKLTRLLKDGKWQLLPPPEGEKLPIPENVRDLARRIYRDATVGAPRGTPASPRR
jgi:hypothetical protein